MALMPAQLVKIDDCRIPQRQFFGDWNSPPRYVVTTGEH
jgi:hypothetical protein